MTDSISIAVASAVAPAIAKALAKSESHMTKALGEIESIAKAVSEMSVQGAKAETLLEARDVAEVLRVSSATARRYMNDGTLPFVVLPGQTTKKVRRSDVDELISRCLRQGAEE